MHRLTTCPPPRTTHCVQDTLLLALHPSARNVLGERNIAFLTGPDHKALRKSFLALFTRKALSVSLSFGADIWHARVVMRPCIASPSGHS
jgi:cytochrome P450